MLRRRPENEGLIHRGEQRWPAAELTRRTAIAILSAQNRAGRDNEEVLRESAGFVRGRLVRRWQIDFPPHFDEREARLYERPWRLLQRRIGATGGRGWVNPGANRDLRATLARLERYLVSPKPGQARWEWLPSTLLPDSSLVAVARDDDFTLGVLASRVFCVWSAHWLPGAEAQDVVAAFPFPWAPAAPLGSLSRVQQEVRQVLARAARAGRDEEIDGAVAEAYGFPVSCDDDELLERLLALAARG